MAFATVIAEWAEPVLGLRRVFLFGSRVRGDHRPDSDVDLCIDRTNDVDADLAIDWWLAANASGFADLRSILPGPLSPCARIGARLGCPSSGGPAVPKHQGLSRGS
jgi:hypothetical protein